MQQKIAEPLAKLDSEDESAAARENQEKLTKLSYRQELERFLSYGKWDLTDEDIERINKDEENKQRVSIIILNTNTNLRISKLNDRQFIIFTTPKKDKVQEDRDFI